MQVSRIGRTSHPGIQAVWLAKQINLQSGGTVIAPWEIDHLPDEWVELILGMGQPLGEMQQAREKVNKIFEKYRKEHPTYRKAK